MKIVIKRYSQDKILMSFPSDNYYVEITDGVIIITERLKDICALGDKVLAVSIREYYFVIL